MDIHELNNRNIDSENGSSAGKMLSILVVDDDRTCLAIVARLLKGCNYQVFTAKDPLDALRILWTRTINFDLIVSDVHMPGLNGFELQRRIHQEFQLPVVLMSGDAEAPNLCEGSQSGASFFIVKPISTEDLKAMWDFGNQWKKNQAKGKNIISNYGYDNDNEDDIGNKLYEKNSKRKLQIIDNDDHDDGKNIAMKGKSLATIKNKVVWTPNLHDKFVKALQYLGPQRSVPRNILNVMNVPSLRREHVASHLQKFRNYEKKRSEAEHDPNMFNTLKTGKMWSSSFLSHEALLGYGQSKLLTDPGFLPSGLTSGTCASQMYQPEIPKFPSSDKIFSGFNHVQTLAPIHLNDIGFSTYQPEIPKLPSSDKIFSGFNHVQTLAPVHLNDNGFSTQMQPPNCYIGSGQEVYPTFVLQNNSMSPTFDVVVPELQPYESDDLCNIFLDGSTYQSTDANKNQDNYDFENNFGEAFLVNEDMPNAEKVHTNLKEQKNGEEVNWASSGSNNTTKVDELVFGDEKNPSEKQDNGGIVNSEENIGASNFESKGNQPSTNDQQGIGEDLWAFLLSDFHEGDNYF